MSTQFTVIFDNGGSITLQTRNYCHVYNDPNQAAHDVRILLNNQHPDDWDGNDPASRMIYDYNIDRNGGYKWHNRATVKAAIKAGTIDWIGWRNIQGFYQALGLILPE